MKKLVMFIVAAVLLAGCSSSYSVKINDKEHPDANTYTIYATSDIGDPTGYIFHATNEQYNQVDVGNHATIVADILTNEIYSIENKSLKGR